MNDLRLFLKYKHVASDIYIYIYIYMTWIAQFVKYHEVQKSFIYPGDLGIVLFSFKKLMKYNFLKSNDFTTFYSLIP